MRKGEAVGLLSSDVDDARGTFNLQNASDGHGLRDVSEAEEEQMDAGDVRRGSGCLRSPSQAEMRAGE